MQEFYGTVCKVGRHLVERTTVRGCIKETTPARARKGWCVQEDITIYYDYFKMTSVQGTIIE